MLDGRYVDLELRERIAKMLRFANFAVFTLGAFVAGLYANLFAGIVCVSSVVVGSALFTASVSRVRALMDDTDINMRLYRQRQQMLVEAYADIVLAHTPMFTDEEPGPPPTPDGPPDLRIVH